MNKKLDTVKLSRLKKIIELIERNNDKDVEVTFEYMIASCFPRVWNNIQKRLSYEHTQGYIQGREDAENEIKRNS
jgi:hypothetical protein